MSKWLLTIGLALSACASDNDTNSWHIGMCTGRTFRELPHRIAWHDGWDGPELVRLQLVTNVTSYTTSIVKPDGSVESYVSRYSNRVVNVISDGKTNAIDLEQVGHATQYIKTNSPSCQCCSNCLTLEKLNNLQLGPWIETTHGWMRKLEPPPESHPTYTVVTNPLSYFK